MPTGKGCTNVRRVRMVTLGDSAGLIDLWHQTWTTTYGPSLGKDIVDEMLRGLNGSTTAMLPGKGERGYCLMSGDGIIGSAIVAERGPTAYLWGMYVLPQHQRSGAGSQLLETVAAELRMSERLEVRVLASSPWAQAFYRKHGFQPVGEEDTEIMTGVRVTTSILAVEIARLSERSLMW